MKAVIFSFLMLFSTMSFAGGKMEAFFDDVGDSLSELGQDIEYTCKNRFKSELLILLSATEQYVLKEITLDQLKTETYLSQGSLAALAVVCVIPDANNSAKDRLNFYKYEYKRFRELIRMGIKQGKGRLWFGGELLKMGVKAGISDLQDTLDEMFDEF